ncbi:MAG: TetR-like C-terminal domain-containing protein, partial [Nitriliruptoraceae bacterium]
VVPATAPVGRPAPERLLVVGRAYRAWAVTHPNEFGLLFGDPIPGYEAPAAGPTVEAMGRVGAALARPILEAAVTGTLRVDPELADPALHGPPGALDRLLPEGTDRAVGPLLLLAWGRLHGQVSLEVFGHHRWLYPDGCEALVLADLHRTVRDLGLAPAAGERP